MSKKSSPAGLFDRCRSSMNKGWRCHANGSHTSIRVRPSIWSLHRILQGSQRFLRALHCLGLQQFKTGNGRGGIRKRTKLSAAVVRKLNSLVYDCIIEDGRSFGDRRKPGLARVLSEMVPDKGKSCLRRSVVGGEPKRRLRWRDWMWRTIQKIICFRILGSHSWDCATTDATTAFEALEGARFRTENSRLLVRDDRFLDWQEIELVSLSDGTFHQCRVQNGLDNSGIHSVPQSPHWWSHRRSY